MAHPRQRRRRRQAGAALVRRRLERRRDGWGQGHRQDTGLRAQRQGRGVGHLLCAPPVCTSRAPRVHISRAPPCARLSNPMRSVCPAAHWLQQELTWMRVSIHFCTLWYLPAFKFETSVTRFPLPVFSPPSRYRSCSSDLPTFPITGRESAKSGATAALRRHPCTVQRLTKIHRKLAPSDGITLRAKPVCWLQAASLSEPSAPAGCVRRPCSQAKHLLQP